MGDGSVQPVEVNAAMALRVDDSMLPLEARMLRTLYQRECSEGSRFRVPQFNKEQLKAVWSAAA